MKTYKDLTLEDLDKWSKGLIKNFAKDWFLEVLRGDYSLEQAREDILSIINAEEAGDE